MIKIYTRTGDKGYTTTRVGEVPKSSDLIGLLGKVDMLNAMFGWCSVVASEFSSKISRTQNQLFEIGAWIACIDDNNLEQQLQSMPVSARDVEVLEHEIDAGTAPPIQNFVLPGGTEFASRLHLTRCIVRDVEHALWKNMSQSTQVHIYFNRLSDWCFSIARDALHNAGHKDVVWTSNKDCNIL